MLKGLEFEVTFTIDGKPRFIARIDGELDETDITITTLDAEGNEWSSFCVMKIGGAV